MGYTHNFAFRDKKNGERTKKINKSKFAAASCIVKHFAEKVKEMGIEIAGPSGDGEPVINNKVIAFNGAGKNAYESFYMDADGSFMDGYHFSNPFCKTERKPYDLLVCLTLLAFKHVFKNEFFYDSDGTTRENINDPENIKYWQSINWTPRIEPEWQKAYDIWDNSPWGKAE